MRVRNIARPAGRFGLGSRGTATAVSVRVAFVAAAACCALTWAPVSQAATAAGSGPTSPGEYRARWVPADSASLASDRVALPLPGLKTLAVSLNAAPATGADGPTAPAETGDATTAPAETGDSAAPAETGSSATSQAADDGDGQTATPLRDGLYAAYLTAVDPANATATFDVVEWFSGTAAQQACTEDGNPGPWPAEQCNDYYVRDKNVVLRTLPVAPKAQLRYVDENGPADGVSLDNPSGGDVPATLSALATKLAQLGPDGRLKCFLGVDSGALTGIAEIFTP